MPLLSNNIYSSVSSNYARVGHDQERVRTSGRERMSEKRQEVTGDGGVTTDIV